MVTATLIATAEKEQLFGIAVQHAHDG